MTLEPASDDCRLESCRGSGRARQVIKQDLTQTLNKRSSQAEGTSRQGITGGRAGLGQGTLTIHRNKTQQEK